MYMSPHLRFRPIKGSYFDKNQKNTKRLYKLSNKSSESTKSFDSVMTIRCLNDISQAPDFRESGRVNLEAETDLLSSFQNNFSLL